MDNSNIRVSTPYSFSLTSPSSFPENPLIGISVTLPSRLYKTVASLYTEKLKKCAIISSKGRTSLDCDIYNLEVLSEHTNFINLASSSAFTFSVDSLINPNVQHTCTTADVNQFLVKIINWNSGDILFISSPSIDDKNCVSFNKNKFDINIAGPLTVFAGLSYTYSIALEKKADQL